MHSLPCLACVVVCANVSMSICGYCERTHTRARIIFDLLVEGEKIFKKNTRNSTKVYLMCYIYI